MQSVKELINQKKVIIVGSGSQCDWMISDYLIDEKHCQLSFIGENKYLIADLGSRHGTYVNNEKINHKEINENDFITIGSKIFQLKSAYDTAQNIQGGGDTETPPDNYKSEANHFNQDTSGQSQNNQAFAEEPGKNKSLKIYCLYASEDEQAAIFLDKHLAALKHNQHVPIEVIGNFNRRAGDDRGTDAEQLKNANIILVFISADLISNESSYNKTMIAIDNHNKGKSLLLPILTRRCMWKDTPFSQLPLLPKNLEPLYSKKSWENEDDSFSNVVSEIKNAISVFYNKEQEYKKNNIGNNSSEGPLLSNTQLKTDFRSGYYWGIFWKRTFAYILDSFMIFIPIGFVMYFVNEGNYDPEAGEFDLTQTVLMFTCAILLFSYFESSKNMASPGKKLLGLVITDENSGKLSFQKAMTRNLIKYAILFLTINPVLSVLYIIGQIAFYAVKHQFFQDMLSKTVISPRIKKI